MSLATASGKDRTEMNLSPRALRSRKTVREVMTTDLLTLNLNDTLRLADDIMNLAKVRHFPVLDRDQLVGVLNQTDLLQSRIVAMSFCEPRSW